MKYVPKSIFVITAFILGACASTALHSGSSKQAEAAPSRPTVIHLADAKRQSAPSKKAVITHLALGKNAFLARLEMAANGKVPLHQDATEEYIHILEGTGRMSIDGHWYKVKAGTTVYMPAKASVQFENGPEKLVALQIFAGPEPAKKYNKWEVLSP
jgi:quercetin dioxygenase-like cupin family protein